MLVHWKLRIFRGVWKKKRNLTINSTWESSTLEMFPSPLMQNLRTTCDESTSRLNKLFMSISTTATLPPHFWSINWQTIAKKVIMSNGNNNNNNKCLMTSSKINGVFCFHENNDQNLLFHVDVTNRTLYESPGNWTTYSGFRIYSTLFRELITC